MRKKREYDISEEFDRSYANPIEICIGHALFQHLSGEGTLREKFGDVVRKVSRASGVDIPQIKITENPAPNSYSIKIFDVQVGKGKIYPGLLLIRDYDEAIRAFGGHRGFDPLWGAPYPCLWIAEKDAGQARNLGFEALNGEELLIRHLEFILQIYKGEFIDPKVFREILMEIESSHPELIQRVLKRTNIPTLFDMVRNLVSEGISFNHLTTILNHIAEDESLHREERIATEQMRAHLKFEICLSIAPEKTLHCIILNPALQMYFALKNSYISRRNAWGRYLISELRRIYRNAESKDYTPVLLCIPEIRPYIHSLLRSFFPGRIILKTTEIPTDHEVSIVEIIEPPLWRIIPSLVIPYIKAFGDLKYLGVVWKSTDAYMEIIDKAEEEFIMGRINKSFENRLNEENNNDAEQGLKHLPALPPPSCAELTPGQKAAIFLLGSPPYYVKEVLSRLDPRNINALGREMAKLAKYSHGYRDQILKEFPELDHKCCDFEEAAKFVQASLDNENYKPQPRAVQRLALLLTSISGKTGESVTSFILPRLPKDILETLIVEINSFRFAIATELKAQIIEEFLMFYRSSRQPQTLLTSSFYHREIQILSLSHPKEFANALQTLWLNAENIINRFNHWAGQDPHHAAVWINRFFLSSAKIRTDFRLLEKATYIIHAISPELSSGVLKNIKAYSKLLLHRERLGYLSMSRSQQNEILSQFLSHYFSLYFAKFTQPGGRDN